MLAYIKNEMPEAEGAEAFSAPTRYSQPLAETQCSAPPVVSVGFSGDGSRDVSFILRSHGGRELKRIEANKDNQADERPKSFLRSLARLMYRSNR
jgi:hypothetical protein